MIFLIIFLITIILLTGILGEDSGNNLEVILYWELASLFKKGSLIDKLINEDKGYISCTYSMEL